MTLYLGRLPNLYAACEQFLELRSSQPNRTGRPGRLRRRAGIRINEPVLKVRERIAGALTSWCEMVIDQRGVTRPPSLRINLLASFLNSNLDWLATHPAAADFAAEMHDLVAAAHQVLDPDPGYSRDLGHCIEDGCPERVRARFGTLSGSSTGQLTCDAGHAWPPSQWLLLRDRLQQ